MIKKHISSFCTDVYAENPIARVVTVIGKQSDDLAYAERTTSINGYRGDAHNQTKCQRDIYDIILNAFTPSIYISVFNTIRADMSRERQYKFTYSIIYSRYLSIYRKQKIVLSTIVICFGILYASVTCNQSIFIFLLINSSYIRYGIKN